MGTIPVRDSYDLFLEGRCYAGLGAHFVLLRFGFNATSEGTVASSNDVQQLQAVVF